MDLVNRFSVGLRVQGQGDLVSRLRNGIIGVVIWLIRFLNLLTKSP